MFSQNPPGACSRDRAQVWFQFEAWITSQEFDALGLNQHLARQVEHVKAPDARYNNIQRSIGHDHVFYGS
jgi:hypothetical protein